MDAAWPFVKRDDRRQGSDPFTSDDIMSMFMDRYAPKIPFPSYAFVPGRHPHPVTDPRGHSFGQPHPIPKPLQPDTPKVSPEFLAAIDLFNAGFYWEAHETWEGLWIAAGRAGLSANFLKGLIKLAAAGVKAREGQAVGVERHARRAARLFRSVRETQPEDQNLFAGLAIDELIDALNLLAARPIIDDTLPSIGGRPVIPFFELNLTPSTTRRY